MTAGLASRHRLKHCLESQLVRERGARRRRLLHHGLQGALAVLSMAAIALVDLGATPAAHQAGNLIGLASQPLWLITTWRHRQWGMFIAAIFYAGIWSAGVYRHL